MSLEDAIRNQRQLTAELAEQAEQARSDGALRRAVRDRGAQQGQAAKDAKDAEIRRT